jgi:hypothetical protein
MVGKSQNYFQTANTGAVADPTGAFAFRAQAGSNVTLVLPDSTTQLLQYNTYDLDYSLDNLYSSKSSLDTAYPNGTYRMTATIGIPTLSFNMATEYYPTATPSVTGATWTNGIIILNPAVANTINFSTNTSYATLGAGGHMEVSLQSANGQDSVNLKNEVVSVTGLPITYSSTPLTSLTIPAGTLTSGHLYEGQLSFDQVGSLDTTTISGGLVVTVWSRQARYYVAAQASGTSTPLPVIIAQPTNQTGTIGGSATFNLGVTVSGGAPNNVMIDWMFNGLRINVDGVKYTFNGGGLTIGNLTSADAGSYYARIVNAGGIVTSNSATLTVNAAAVAPSFTTQPTGQTVTAGTSVTLTAAASGSPAPTYQWKKGGTDIAGATGATLAFNSATAYDAGTYTVVATNSAGSVTSNAASLAVNALDTSGSYLANLSVRVAMASGQTLIVGFVVNGGAKPILVRAAGPVLNKYGLTGVVDPQLNLFNGSNTLVAANDNWDAALATTFATLGAFPFDTGSKDAALQQTINGPNSAQATATGPGALLVEAYDAGPNDGRKLVNLSTRFQVGTGDNILITGFVLSGTGFKQVLIRAVGPKLTDYGVTGVLADPQVGVFNSSGTQIASNDNWSSTLSATFTALGAFALNPGSKDAALVVTLQAGKLYTVQISGVGNTTGEALAEVYALP